MFLQELQKKYFTKIRENETGFCAKLVFGGKTEGKREKRDENAEKGGRKCTELKNGGNSGKKPVLYEKKLRKLLTK